MAFSVKQIKSILSNYGVPVESLEPAAEEICKRHKTDLDSILEERDTYKAEAEKVPELQKALEADGVEVLQKKLEKLQKEYNEYKSAQETKETMEKKTNAYRQILKEAGISEKRIDAIVKVSASAIDSLEMDDTGKVKDQNKLIGSIKSEWADFIVTTNNKTDPPETPPAQTPNSKEVFEKMSLTEQMTYANEHPAEVAEWLK